MIRKIFSKFIALFASLALTSNRRSPVKGSPGSPAGDLPFSGGSPKIRKPKYDQPGSHPEKPLVANCRKIWRNRHGIH